jgi:hypothetical protein
MRLENTSDDGNIQHGSNQLSEDLKSNLFILSHVEKRKRRSKHEAEGRLFRCEICDKGYLSQPALNSHIANKHSQGIASIDKKTRGRPRKYVRYFLMRFFCKIF